MLIVSHNKSKRQTKRDPFFKTFFINEQIKRERERERTQRNKVEYPYKDLRKYLGIGFFLLKEGDE